MTSGELYNTWPGGPTLTFASIPYTQYDVYVYADIDASGRNETVSLTPSGGSAQYYSFTTQDGGSVWTQGTNTWNGSGTAPTLPGANYVHYTGLTASSFTLNWGAPSNGGLNGIQIVNTGGTPTAPSAPTGLGATAGNTQVALGWTASSGATSYNVYRGTSAGGESATAIATGITTTSYTNTGLTNGTTYYFEVKAVNASGSSSYSNETSATPNATSSAITWGAAQNMVGTSDVSTTGAQFDATTFFGSAVSVNGVSFNPLAASGTLGDTRRIQMEKSPQTARAVHQ